MRIVRYSEFRAKIKSICDAVCADGKSIVIGRKDNGDLVLIARRDFDSLNETAYLLRSPANAKRLLEAVQRRKRTAR